MWFIPRRGSPRCFCTFALSSWNRRTATRRRFRSLSVFNFCETLTPSRRRACLGNLDYCRGSLRHAPFAVPPASRCSHPFREQYPHPRQATAFGPVPNNYRKRSPDLPCFLFCLPVLHAEEARACVHCPYGVRIYMQIGNAVIKLRASRRNASSLRVQPCHSCSRTSPHASLRRWSCIGTNPYSQRA